MPTARRPPSRNHRHRIAIPCIVALHLPLLDSTNDLQSSKLPDFSDSIFSPTALTRFLCVCVAAFVKMAYPQKQQYPQQQYPPQQQPQYYPQQHGGAPVMAAVVAAPMMPMMQMGFSQPLLNCNDDGAICLEELFCSYCHAGFLYQWMEDRTQQMSPLACCGTLCIDAIFLAGIARCVLVSHIRQRLANLYQIHENGCDNVMTSFCCSYCAMCQMHREMVMRQCFTGGICYKPPVAYPFPSQVPMGRRW